MSMIRALIVDDESLVRKGLRLTVPWEDYGIEIAGEAATGEKALEFVRGEPVDLLLADITMPGMSGLELTKRLRQEYPGIKVVILTCHQDFDYIQEALRLGAIDYIVKTQLEDMDLSAAMERICKAVREGKRASLPSSALPAEALRKVGEASAGLGWIADEARFAALAESVREAGGDAAPELERAMAAAVEGWRIRLPMFAWSEHPQPEAALLPAWLERLRDAILRWLRRSQYSEDVIQAILKAVDRIAERPGSHEKQGEVSQSVNLSKSYFSTCFRDITRMTFTQFLQHVSVYAARDMLLQTNYPVYIVAERCGFSDQRYFSKMFKEQTGLLPSEYRQRFSERT
ncbi:hypothetical protein B1A99_23765 [Cohnella sp. CIP 111063]|uniref:response regulator transcription factor n=1 Tax=unclassified Cohnella TaxID=2636738 RepID=UPI000B8C6C7F|nr:MULTISPECIES: response regulator [unclassified Cohnella]OXS55294.1 hypothetical protein B1A99_23765 [Cohnella sp. CIP 111063]PRX65721.1 two-component system response regulator YesN [Cohnella sp. SGD-V74]